jgi:hypothetical protein
LCLPYCQHDNILIVKTQILIEKMWKNVFLSHCSHLTSIYSSLMTEAARTSETSVDNYFTRRYIPEDNSELHTRRRENLKSHMLIFS